MEFASYLAGERWSDHPSCTHPLLAQLARGINDHISDEGREKLVPLIPSVVGLTGDDPNLDVRIALRCAATALPVAAHDRQRALAAGLLAAERLRASLEAEPIETTATADLADHIQRARAAAPQAAKWAEHFVVDIDVTPKIFRRRSAPNIVRMSVVGIAEACISDRDDLLHHLLTTAIDDCISWSDAISTTAPAPVTPSRTAAKTGV
ncbi:MAG: hypothetical protein PVJ28_13010 [Acidimicrobiia bacterium]|jgi:hypothetical protein